ncbi:DUF4272 domain-containing protein [Variovorax sp. CF079]|uniref:DUF4272 domain-containing protein n=1 Tax=Variovorax sp. CF079 TaxID=1882774 RepID=UPI00147C792A|nr:DUF4272 domain-containing protein [Variovorax sp. CF079]
MTQRSIEIGGEEGDVPRSLGEVLDRTLALGAAVAASFGAPAAELVAWLQESNLETALTPEERSFLGMDARNAKQVANMSWQSERLLVLLWALRKIEEIPSPAEQCRLGTLEELLPPYGDQSLAVFRESARLRSEDELFDAAVDLQTLHALARQRTKEPSHRASEPAVDIEVVQERHHAINWLVGYEAQSWNEITTDT